MIHLNSEHYFHFLFIQLNQFLPHLEAPVQSKPLHVRISEDEELMLSPQHKKILRETVLMYITAQGHKCLSPIHL